MYVAAPHLPPDAGSRLASLAVRQYGIATRSQLAEIGVGRHAVRAQLASRRWRALNSVVLALHNGPLTREQGWQAAVLACDGPSALAERTAAEAAGLTGWETSTIHVLLVRGEKFEPIPELVVKVHESRRFTRDDIHPTRTPPQVNIERALVDAAVWSARPRTACGVIAAGVQQRLTTAAQIREVLEQAGRVRYRRLLLKMLVDIEGGAQAVSETDFLAFCHRHALPRPRLQVRADSRGRRRYLDAVFKAYDGRLIAVEVDGAMHLMVSTYWHDMARQNDLVIDGRRVLRFPSFAIYTDDANAVAQLRLAVLGPDLSDALPAIAG